MIDRETDDNKIINDRSFVNTYWSFPLYCERVVRLPTASLQRNTITFKAIDDELKFLTFGVKRRKSADGRSGHFKSTNENSQVL